MGNVVSAFSISLDGFIAGANDGAELPLGEGGERLFEWYSSGDTDYVVPSGEMTVKVSSASADLLRESFSKIGAIVSGRRTFDIVNGWNGRHPVDVPLDELSLTVVPVLLGSGVRLFEHLGGRPIEREKVSVIETPDVTHLQFRVVK
jgi:dihydrofolate reductase